MKSLKGTKGESNASDAKPKGLLDKLGGLDVRLTQEELPNDANLNGLISQAGKSLTPPGMTYKGSYATHIYTASLMREAAWVHQQVLGDELSESIVSNAIADLAIVLRKAFNPGWKRKVVDQRDKR